MDFGVELMKKQTAKKNPGTVKKQSLGEDAAL